MKEINQVSDRLINRFFEIAEWSDPLSLFVIQDPAGRSRWIVPYHRRGGIFLRTYNVTSMRAKLISWALYLATQSKLGCRLVAAEQPVRLKLDGILKKILVKFNAVDFAIFCGTIGPNRKIILVMKKSDGRFLYAKIAAGKRSPKLIDSEAAALTRLSHLCICGVKIPKVVEHKHGQYLVLEELQGYKSTVLTFKVRQHVETLLSIYRASGIVTESWSALKSINWLRNKLDCLLNNSNNHSFTARFSHFGQVLTWAGERLEVFSMKDDLVSISIMHGDYTPWNLKVKGSSLGILDWEMSHSGMPLFLDLIHFNVQEFSMVSGGERVSIEARMINIQDAINSSFPNCSTYDFRDNLQFYLALHIITQSELFFSQDQIHAQAYRLLQCWEKLINWMKK